MFYSHEETLPNKADAPNLAIAFWLHSEHHWRGVGDLRRSATSHTARHLRLELHYEK